MSQSYRYKFEKLEIWQLAIALSVKAYRITSVFPSEEKFGLTNQIRRASNSISANIAEGTARFGAKDSSRFIEIAFGSAVEVVSHLELASQLGFISKEELAEIRPDLEELTNKINAFYRANKT